MSTNRFRRIRVDQFEAAVDEDREEVDDVEVVDEGVGELKKGVKSRLSRVVSVCLAASSCSILLIDGSVVAQAKPVRHDFSSDAGDRLVSGVGVSPNAHECRADISVELDGDHSDAWWTLHGGR